MNSKIDNQPVPAGRSGLNREILLTLVLLLGAALMFGGFLFLRFAEQRFLAQRLDLLQEVSQAIADAQLEQGRLRPRPEKLARLRDEWGARAWWLFDRQLHLVDGFKADTVQDPGTTRIRALMLGVVPHLEVDWDPLALLTGRPAGGARVAVPIVGGGSPDGLLLVHFSLAGLQHEIGVARRWVFLYAFGYGLVLAAVGFLLLRRNVIRPVKNLLSATEKVTAGDLAAELSEDGPAEIAQLAGSFNRMTRALGESRRQTEATIASLRESNLALEASRAELVRSEKLATVGHIAAGMAHEIGNPLGALTGYLALLQEDLQQEEQRKIASACLQELERIDRLVRDLLDYAAPGGDDPTPCDPWEVLTDTVRRLQLQGVLKRMKLHLDDPAALPAVGIDRHKLEQVLVNLLLNARDACGEEGTVTCQAELVDGMVELKLTDNGPGMSEDVRGKLFEPFFTTKAPGQGRGLGLAVCQRVLNEAGGDIQVQSTPGKGSCFRLLLPTVGELEHG